MRRFFGSAATQTLAGLAFACLALAWTAPASAFTLYTDRAAWEAALAGSGITTDPFDNDIAAADSITFDSGVQSTGAPAGASGINGVIGGQFEGDIDSSGASGAFDSITWTFPVPVVALGVDWTLAANSDGLMLIGDFDGAGNQVVSLFDALGDPGSGFLGIIGLAPFSSVLLATEDRADAVDGEFFAADNLSFAVAPTAVPEPATLALMGAGLAGLGLLRRRRPR